MKQLFLLSIFAIISCTSDVKKNISEVSTLAESTPEHAKEIENNTEAFPITDSSFSDLIHSISFIYNNTKKNEKHLITVDEKVSNIKIKGVLNYDFNSKNEFIFWWIFRTILTPVPDIVTPL